MMMMNFLKIKVKKFFKKKSYKIKVKLTFKYCAEWSKLTYRKSEI